jgi:hypothetical protein
MNDTVVAFMAKTWRSTKVTLDTRPVNRVNDANAKVSRAYSGRCKTFVVIK